MTRDVRQIIDQFEHATGGPVDPSQRFHLPFRQFWAMFARGLDQQRLRETFEHGQRHPQFVRGDTDELVLELFGLFERGNILVNDERSGLWLSSMC